MSYQRIKFKYDASQKCVLEKQLGNHCSRQINVNRWVPSSDTSIYFFLASKNAYLHRQLLTLMYLLLGFDCKSLLPKDEMCFKKAVVSPLDLQVVICSLFSFYVFEEGCF